MHYAIIDLQNFIKQTKIMACNNFKKINSNIEDNMSALLASENDNLLNILRDKEVELILAPFLQKTEDNKYKISENNFIKVLEKLNKRLISNTMQSLSSKGILESGFDNKLNDFVFWRD